LGWGGSQGGNSMPHSKVVGILGTSRMAGSPCDQGKERGRTVVDDVRGRTAVRTRRACQSLKRLWLWLWVRCRAKRVFRAKDQHYLTSTFKELLWLVLRTDLGGPSKPC
jgi:hypothetical protein